LLGAAIEMPRRQRDALTSVPGKACRFIELCVPALRATDIRDAVMAEVPRGEVD